MQETDLKEQVLVAYSDSLKSVEVLGLISTGAGMHIDRGEMALCKRNS